MATKEESQPLVHIQVDPVNENKSPKPSNRLEPLDTQRGIIIILMALDHASALSGPRIANEVWSNDELQIDSNSLQSVMLFITRYVTHICAIGFFFLMGMGMTFFTNSRIKSGWTPAKLLRYFVVRGIILFVLQFVMEDAVWNLSQFVPGAASKKTLFVFFGILQALGLNMIMSGTLLFIDSLLKGRKFSIKNYSIEFGTVITAFVSIMCLVVESFVIHYANPNANYNPILGMFMIPGTYKKVVFFGDPSFAWLTVTSFGNLFGKLFINMGNDNEKKYRALLITGLCFWVLFIIVRVLGLEAGFWFGNYRTPEHKGAQEFFWAMFTLSKYPPSLSYMLLFLGTDCILIYIVYKTNFFKYPISNPANVYGKSSLCFYITHLWIYLGLSFLWSRFPYNLPIWYAYPIWFTGLILEYPICYYYGNFKARQSYDSIWKLF